MTEEQGRKGPFLRGENTTRRIMGDVALALMPALAGSVYFFGIRSLLLVVTSVITCVLSELVWEWLTGKQITAFDFSAVVTGILIAFQVPVTTPMILIVISGIFAIIVVKQLFGGIGSNFMNPALAGRLLLMVVWPGKIIQYVPAAGTDAVSSATVLAAMKAGEQGNYSWLDMFLGYVPGALGETSKLLLLVGAGYLCYRGLINVKASLAYILTVLVVTFVLGGGHLFGGDPVTNLLGGSLILGACYMLTDYSFISARGRLIYSVAAGIITGLVRIYSSYPEDVCFGILAANCMVGLLARFEQKHVYGTKYDKDQKTAM